MSRQMEIVIDCEVWLATPENRRAILAHSNAPTSIKNEPPSSEPPPYSAKHPLGGAVILGDASELITGAVSSGVVFNYWPVGILTAPRREDPVLTTGDMLYLQYIDVLAGKAIKYI